MVSFAPAITFNSKVEKSRALVPIARGLAAHSASAPEHAGVNGAFNQDSFKWWHWRICVTDIHRGYCWWIKTPKRNNTDSYLPWNGRQILLLRQIVTARASDNWTTLLYTGVQLTILSSKLSLLMSHCLLYSGWKGYMHQAWSNWTPWGLSVCFWLDTYRSVSPLRVMYHSICISNSTSKQLWSITYSWKLSQT